jgi:hypothetical protein
MVFPFNDSIHEIPRCPHPRQSISADRGSQCCFRGFTAKLFFQKTRQSQCPIVILLVYVHVGCPEQGLCTPFNLLEVVLWVGSKDTMFSWARWEKNCICGMSNQEYQTASLGSPWMILSCLFCLIIFTFFGSWNRFHSVSLHLEGTHLNLQTAEDVQVSSLCAARVCQPVNNWYTWHSLCSIDHPMQNWRHEEFEHSLLDQYQHSLMVLTQWEWRIIGGFSSTWYLNAGWGINSSMVSNWA